MAVSSIDLPLKIEWPIISAAPYSILGLGEPGFFVAFTYKFDLQQNSRVYYKLFFLEYHNFPNLSNKNK